MNTILENTKIRFLALALVVIVPLELLSLLNLHLPVWIEWPVFAIVIIGFGKDVFTTGIKALLRLNFSDINLLLTIAVVGAVYLHEFEEAAVIVVLFALGNALEDFGVQRSKTALKSLVERTPKLAQIKGKPTKSPITDVQVGQVIVIKPGDQIPLDGTVVVGTSLVDESTITGEPLPKSKFVTSTVYAGTMNGHGYLEVAVTKLAQDTTLNKIVQLTTQSIEQKAQSQRFIEQFAHYYTPAIMLIAIGLVVVPVIFFGQPFSPWLIQALTLLLIACPCALVISTPIAIFSAMGNASQQGALIKGGRVLEVLGHIKAIAFDKTRTLTKGNPTVSDIIPCAGFTVEEVLACASGIEALSEHPIAHSVVMEAGQQKLVSHPFTNFQAVLGKGLKGECTICTDVHHCLGSIEFIKEEHPVGPLVLEKVNELEQQGKTAILMSDQGGVKGVIGVTDELRSESKATIERLKKLGLTPVMLTGDNPLAAQYVARQLDIQEVKAELLPDGKAIEMRQLLERYGQVAMIGDGVNDAPALATASVGIAMGAIGSDMAIENADIALMNTNLQLVVSLVELGRRVNQTIRFNTTLAIVIKFLFLVLALIGMSNLAFAIFADVGVTVLVIFNSLRLYRSKSDNVVVSV